MSTLTTKQLQGQSINSNIINVVSGSSLKGGSGLVVPGTVLQVVPVRSDTRTSFSAPVGLTGTVIYPLEIVITPKYANSRLLLKWMLNGEGSGNDMVFEIYRNRDHITIAGEEGRYNQSLTTRWGGFVANFYDQDYSSTPSNWLIQYSCLAGTTDRTSFSLHVSSSSATAYTFYLNRAQASTGAQGQENMISIGTCWEIAQ